VVPPAYCQLNNWAFFPSNSLRKPEQHCADTNGIHSGLLGPGPPHARGRVARSGQGSCGCRRENGNRGTDHGRATAMLVLGGNAHGGKVHGHWPTLAPEKREYGRDLAVTTDFRDLFAEVLVGHLGSADLSAVFPGYKSDPSRWVGAMRR